MIPAACYRLASSNLAVIAGHFRSPEDKTAANRFFYIMWDFAAFTRPDHGVPANAAYAHHDSNRNVLDEWV